MEIPQFEVKISNGINIAVQKNFSVRHKKIREFCIQAKKT